MNNSFDVKTKSSMCCVSAIATEASMLTSYPLPIMPRSTTKWRVLHFTSTLKPLWQNRPEENKLTKSQRNILSLQIFLTERKTEKKNIILGPLYKSINLSWVCICTVPAIIIIW